MEHENTPITPVGVVLIATFWIFIGTWFLSTTSGYLSNSAPYHLFGMIPMMGGIGLILLGWGLLSLKEWAYTLTFICSIFGLFSLFYAVPILFSSVYQGYYHTYGIPSFVWIIPFAFIPMTWYLSKKGETFGKKRRAPTDRFCPTCGRSIPFDAVYCPYCQRKFDTFL